MPDVVRPFAQSACMLRVDDACYPDKARHGHCNAGPGDAVFGPYAHADAVQIVSAIVGWAW